MSAINDKIKKLKDREKQLELQQRRVEFLQHILDSAQTYDHKDFVEVKADVVQMLENFVTSAITSIVDGTPVSTAVQPTESAAPAPAPTPVPTQPQKPVAPKKVDQSGMSAPDKLDFALSNRHMSNKRVSVANEENMTIHGLVVGLDAPFVVVKTDAGPTINVPIGKVSPL